MSDPSPWNAAETGAQARKHAPATLRNRYAITHVLRAILPDRGRVLEIASGSGEHVIHFARAFPHLSFQPSDRMADACRSIAAYRAEAGLENIEELHLLDVEAPDWQVGAADAVLCINMVHIAPWRATEALFRGCAKLLPQDGPLYLYGPYIRDDLPTSPSNLEFHALLQSRDPEWGLRNMADMDALAADHGFAKSDLVAMPANNVSLVYRKMC